MADIDDIPISDDDDSELDADSMSNREFDEIAFDVDNPLMSDYEFLGEETREIDGEEVLLIVPDAIANEDIFVAESDNLEAEEIEEIDNDSTAIAETIEEYDNTAVIPTIGAVTAGERVMVVLKNGIPTAMGSTGFGDDINLRVHEIEADYIKTEVLEAERVRVNNLLANKADVSSLTAEQIRVDNLLAGKASVSDLSAATGRIDDLEADHVSTDDLEAEQIRVNNLLAAKASVSDLSAEQIRVDNLLADKADISTLEAEYAHVTNGTIDNAKINHADVTGLNAEVANIADARISQATITQAQVQNLSADYAKITNGKIDSALINTAAIVDEQVFKVTGNKATIEEINADTITVRNLHTANLVVDTAQGYVTIGDKKTPTKEALDSLIGTLQNEIDGAVETFTSSAVPLLSNYPASDWQISGATAEEQRKAYAKHVGDICYVQNTASAQNGYAYRFAYDSTEQTFKWVLIKDSDVTKALGDISDLQTFESETNTWIEETDEGLRTIRENHTSLSGVVDKTLVSSTQLWFSKANTTAPNKPTAQVTSTATSGNAWTTAVPAYNASYPNYFYCYQWKYADGTFGWSAVTRDIAMGESQAQARKGVSDAAAADGKATTAQNTANANIKSSVQLWFTKTTNAAPSKPSSVISTNNASTANAWNLAVPTYNSSYPHYFYCYQQQKGDGTYQWTDVVYDRATTENQAVARAALPSSTFETFRTTTFKEIVDTVDEQSTSITTLSEKTSTLANPNLTPWFSAQTSVYWGGAFSVNYDYATGHGHGNSTEGSKDVTYLNDGWTHVILDSRASAGNENKNSYINTWVNRNQLGDITPGGTYTWLIEVRNLSITKDTLRVRPSIGNATLDIFSEVPVNTTDSGCAFSEDGAKWIQVTAKSDLSNVTRDTRGYIYVITDVYVEADVRVSLYEGEYSGPYKPYVERLENITEISNTVNTVRQTADTNTASITNLTKTVADNKTDIESRASTIEQNLSGITTRVGKTESELETVSNPNLSPFFSHPLNDFYDADENPNSYWLDNRQASWTELGDGWAHISLTAGSSATAFGPFYVREKPKDLKPSTTYTFMLEWRNVVASRTGSDLIAYMAFASDYDPQPDAFPSGTISYEIVDESGVAYKTATTIADFSDTLLFVRSYLGVRANGTFSGDIRISFYEGNYSGPYKPFVDQTLSSRVSTSETKIEQHSDALTLTATKTEVYQISQPNLIPFFSSTPVADISKNSHWISRSGTRNNLATFTDVGDGWCRIYLDNTGYSAVSRCDFTCQACPSIENDADYTFLFEYRNNNTTQGTGSSASQVYIVQQGSPISVQFWGNAAQKLIDGYGTNCTVNLDGSAGSGGELFEDGIYRKRVVRRSEAADSAYYNRTGAKACFCFTAYAGAGEILDVEMRLSVYPGEYTGPYKPYAGAQLYASQAQLKVANDEIALRVEKNDVINQINVSTEGAKIEASKVEINGTAIFSAISSDVDDAITDKGYATTTEAQGYASTAQTNAINAAATDATSKANQAEQNAKTDTTNKLKSYSTTTDMNTAITDAVNDISVGGRNLYSMSSAVMGYIRTSDPIGDVVLTPSQPQHSTSDFIPVSEGDVFTFQMWNPNLVVNTVNSNRAVCWYDSSKAYISWQGGSGDAASSRPNGTAYWSFTCDPAPANAAYARFGFIIGPSTNAIDPGIKVKVERGNKATDWTPAPEDQEEYVNKSINDIQLGGRNLARFTSMPTWQGVWSANYDPSKCRGWFCYASGQSACTYTEDGGIKLTGNSSMSNKDGLVIPLAYPDAMVGGEEYTISFWYRTNLSTLGTPYLLYLTDGSTTIGNIPRASVPIEASITEWKYFSEAMVFPSTNNKSIGALLLYYNNTANSWLEIRYNSFKVEKGNKATDWSPAPEDAEFAAKNSPGRNLVLGSGIANAHEITSVNSSNYATYEPYDFVKAVNKLVDVGSSWTLSYDWATDATEGNFHPEIAASPYSFGTTINSIGSLTAINHRVYVTSDNQSGHVEATYTVTNTVAASTATKLRFRVDGANWVGKTLTLSNVKLEQGIKASQWSPAPEDALTKTQRIYYRSFVSGTPTKPTGWVTANTDIYNKTATIATGWSQKITPIAASLNPAAADKYLYLYTCEQSMTPDGQISYTDICLDASTTIIDGARIVTGSVTAQALNAESVKSDIVQTTNLDASKITSGSIDADRIKATVINAVNNGTGTINADKINVSAISIGESQVTGLTNDLDNKANSSDLTAETNKRKAVCGTCSTAAGTVAKVVECSNFELYTGATITVIFSTANTAAAPKLNVNSTGDIAVRYNSAVASTSNPVRWGAGAVLTFVYNGVGWVLSETPPSYTLPCSTAAGTRDKAASSSGALVVNGTRLTLRFSTANTYVAASVRVNFSSTGALNVYVDNAVTSTSNTLTWAANTTLTFIQQGSGWYLVSNDQASKTATTYITDITSGGVMVHRSNNANTGVQITDNVDIMRAGDSIAMFGTDGNNQPISRIGYADSGHTEQTSDAFTVYADHPTEGLSVAAEISTGSEEIDGLTYRTNKLNFSTPNGPAYFEAIERPTLGSRLKLWVDDTAHTWPSLLLGLSTVISNQTHTARMEFTVEDEGPTELNLYADYISLGAAQGLSLPTNSVSSNEIESLASTKLTGTINSARLPTVPIDKGGTGDTGVETVTAQGTIFTSVTSGMIISNLTCATWGKMCMLSFTVHPSSAQTSAFVIGTLATAYRPVAACTANPYHSSVATARIQTNGTIQMTAAPANDIPVSFTYLLA